MAASGIRSRLTIEITPDLIERFWVKTSSGEGDSCWKWNGADRGNGYGCLKVAKRVVSAHCVSFVIHFGQIPEGKLVLHTFDNRGCVNPAHLYAGTPKQNVADMDARKRSRRVRGAQCPNAKLNDTSVRAIHALHKLGVSNAEIARQLQVSAKVIDRIFRGEGWKHVIQTK